MFGGSTILIATSVIPTAAMPFKVNATGTKDTSGQRYVTFVHLTDMFIAFPSINETPASKVSSTRWVPGQYPGFQDSISLHFRDGRSLGSLITLHQFFLGVPPGLPPGLPPWVLIACMVRASLVALLWIKHE